MRAILGKKLGFQSPEGDFAFCYHSRWVRQGCRTFSFSPPKGILPFATVDQNSRSTRCVSRVSVPRRGFCLLLPYEYDESVHISDLIVSVPRRGFCLLLLGKEAEDFEVGPPNNRRVSVPRRGFCLLLHGREHRLRRYDIRPFQSPEGDFAFCYPGHCQEKGTAPERFSPPKGILPFATR